MLKDFFKLDGKFSEMNERQLQQHLTNHSEIRDALYRPDDWPQSLRSIKNTNFTNVSLSKTLLRETTFTNCKFENCLFIGTKFESVNFHNTRFKNCNFHKVDIVDCYFDPNSIELDKVYKSDAANIGVHLFQKLYENSSTTRQPFFEIEADIKFRQWKRSQLFFDHKTGRLSLYRLIGLWLRSILYEYVCGFGYRPARFAIATLICFFLFSTINWYAFKGGLSVNGQAAAAPSFLDSIFYTFSVMTVLGFSSIVPVLAKAKLITVLEALIGVGWMGIFTSLLVKRFLK